MLLAWLGSAFAGGLMWRIPKDGVDDRITRFVYESGIFDCYEQQRTSKLLYLKCLKPSGKLVDVTISISMWEGDGQIFRVLSM